MGNKEGHGEGKCRGKKLKNTSGSTPEGVGGVEPSWRRGGRGRQAGHHLGPAESCAKSDPVHAGPTACRTRRNSKVSLDRERAVNRGTARRNGMVAGVQVHKGHDQWPSIRED